jgi:hypothetical protein
VSINALAKFSITSCFDLQGREAVFDKNGAETYAARALGAYRFSTEQLGRLKGKQVRGGSYQEPTLDDRRQA